jgi:hypothetical protein
MNGQGFGKKLHWRSTSLTGNFLRPHQALNVSPAMAAGVTDCLWEMVDVVDVLDAFEAVRKRRPKVTFEVPKWTIGGGFYVCARMQTPSQSPCSIRLIGHPPAFA